MREPPFVVDVPTSSYLLDDHCANCLELLADDVEGLFCSSWCSEIASTVRYMRRVFRDGRIDAPDVAAAVQTRGAFLLIGGYEALGRGLRPQVRTQVKQRDGGKCRSCGKPGSEIDHIAGSSGELENLQLLCGDCHRAKTSTHLVPASTDQAALLQSLMLNRVAPEAPRLLADDDANWQDAWRGLKAARRRRFIDKLESEGVDLHGLKTRADMVLAREDAMDDWSSGPVFMLDDDGGYGPSSYFARLTRSDD